MMFATVLAARMWDCAWVSGWIGRVTVRTLMASMPWLLVFFACSLRIMNGLPYYPGSALVGEEEEEVLRRLRRQRLVEPCWSTRA